MFNFGKKKKQATTTKELVKEVKSLEERLEKTAKELALLQKAHEKAVTKVGMVRFNPFGEIGGDQSFSIALLDSKDSGVVITSHYGKDIQRIYAKPIKEGKSEHSLSMEEEEAIKKARS
ncbi:DUF4446 family protein [Patescibacteria group bacterium]|nr:DUF4446 family protein [Patescibacteria group bacterium]